MRHSLPLGSQPSYKVRYINNVIWLHVWIECVLKNYRAQRGEWVLPDETGEASQGRWGVSWVDKLEQHPSPGGKGSKRHFSHKEACRLPRSQAVLQVTWCLAALDGSGRLVWTSLWLVCKTCRPFGLFCRSVFLKPSFSHSSTIFHDVSLYIYIWRGAEYTTPEYASLAWRLF